MFPGPLSYTSVNIISDTINSFINGWITKTSSIYFITTIPIFSPNQNQNDKSSLLLSPQQLAPAGNLNISIHLNSQPLKTTQQIHIVWVATEVLVIRVALKLQNNTLIREVF
jgi:hypothetical protein